MPLNNRIWVAVRSEERERLENIAKERGLSVSALIRTRIRRLLQGGKSKWLNKNLKSKFSEQL